MDPMLRKALRRYRELRTQFENCLLGEDGDRWEAGSRKFLAKRPCWVESGKAPVPKTLSVPPTPRPILERVGVTTIAATTNPFVVANKFVVNIGCKAGVKISNLGGNFLAWFGGAVEGPIAETNLACDKLLCCSTDGPIIAEIGGVSQALTGLTHMFSLMERQPRGEDPNGRDWLLSSYYSWNIGYAAQKVTKLEGERFSYVNFTTSQKVVEEVENAGYLFEINGQWYVLRAVIVCWYIGGWCVFADPAGSSDRWRDGGHVFSRNSEPKPSETLTPA